MKTAAQYSFVIILFILLQMFSRTPKDIDRALLPYVEAFEKWTDTDTGGRYYSIKFDLQRPGVAGIAIGMHNNDAVIVRIDPMVWIRLSEAQRSWLVWHELAHDLHNSLHGSSFLMARQIPIFLTANMLEVIKGQYLQTLENGTNKI